MKELDVVLVYPPFVNGFFPSYGLSIINAFLKKNKINSKILYANLYLKNELMAFDFYELVCSSFNMYEIGEFVFAEQAFPEVKNKLLNILGKNYFFPETMGMRYTSLNELRKIQNIIPKYIDEIVSKILSENPKIVGFHITFSQINASISIANEIKKRKPEIIVVFGGYMANDPMVKQILSFASCFDYAFSGEAEFDFFIFVNNILSNKKLPDKKLILCDLVHDLNSLPIPDYTDFFMQLNELKMDITRIIFYESSRGCWWGEKFRCLFCGINENLKYRYKSIDRIKKELNFLIDEYKPARIMTVDNIIPYFLINKNLDFNKKKIPILYETKSNMDLKKLNRLKKLNVINIQPGIETLSTNLLKILRKGTTAIGNLKFLRDCCKLKINVLWNFLYGIPGENEEDYLKMMDFIPLVYHLPPPILTIPLTIQRYSPLFNNLKSNDRKPVPFELIYNFFPDNTNFENLSIYFKTDYPLVFRNNTEIKKLFFSTINEWWKCNTNKVELTIKRKSKDSFVITDTRPLSKQKEKIINKKQYLILKLLNDPIQKDICLLKIKKLKIENDFHELFNDKYILFLDEYYFAPIV